MQSASALPSDGNSEQLSKFFNWRGWRWVTLALCALILIYRRPDAILDPAFWAEDGTYFFTDAREKGWLSLFSTFTNYPLLLVRFSALISSLFPERYAPALYNFVAFANHLAVILYLFSDRIELRWKPLLGIFSVLAPCLGNEPLFNMTNMQWQCVQILLLLILSNDAVTRRQKCFDFVVLILYGLTGPFLVMLIPLIAARWWLSRSAHSRWLLLVAGVLTLVQLAMLKAVPAYGPVKTGFSLVNPIWFGVFGDSIGGVLLMGVNAPLFWLNSVLMTVFSVGLYCFLFVDGFRRKDYTQLAITYTSLAILLAACLNWRAQPEVVIQSSRYHYIQRVFFFWALVQSASVAGVGAIPLRVLSAWALLVAVPLAQSSYAMNHTWPRASQLVNVSGDVDLPCLQTDWRVRLQNGPLSAEALNRTPLLPAGQSVVLGVSPGKAKETTMRLPQAFDCLGVTFVYRARSLNGKPTYLSVSTGRSGRDTVDAPVRLQLKADSQLHSITFYTAPGLEGWVLECAPNLQDVTIESITALR